MIKKYGDQADYSLSDMFMKAKPANEDSNMTNDRKREVGASEPGRTPKPQEHDVHLRSKTLAWRRKASKV